MCQNEIGQCAKNMDIGLASIINTIRTMVYKEREFSLWTLTTTASHFQFASLTPQSL